jgi:competence protein ComEA
MRTRRALDHDAALSRRLAQLGDELSAHPGAVRPARPQAPPTDLTSEPWWDDHTRLAAPRRPPAPAVPVGRPLPGLPPRAAAPPGRHAAARPRGPAGLGPAQLAAVAVVVAAGLAVTCWWLVRGSTRPAPDLAAAPVAGLVSAGPAVAPVDDAVDDSGGSGDRPAGGAAAPATVTVDVAGKVRRPGIAVLDAGSRVIDALKAAGGARPGTDLTGLNLARVLVDGEQVVVGSTPPPGAAAHAVPADGPSGPPALVNLNTATEAELDTLPDVGPVTASSILQWRDQHGGFTSVDELLEVDGIGAVTLGKLAPYVTV